jgi:hypothetical protein
MSLSPIKQEILSSMLLNQQPQTAQDIAQDIQKELQPVTINLLGLQNMGYVLNEKDHYTLTKSGKQILGIPELTKEKAEAILAYAPHDKAFNFYAADNQPLHVHAHNLRDFTTKLEKVDLASIEFHLKRGDFEAWFSCIGDEELTKKTILLKQKNLPSKELLSQLQIITKQRYIELAKLADIPLLPTEQNDHSHHHHHH